MKKIILFIVCSLFLTSCTFSSIEPTLSITDYLLGTIVTVKIYDKDYPAEVEDCLLKVREFEKIVSYVDDDSELSHLNKSAFKEPTIVSDELFDIIYRAMAYCKKTNGNFDIGIGKLIELWGIGTEEARIPILDELEQFIGFKGYEHIILDETNRTVSYTDERVKIHLGACAKGYAEDMIAEYLRDVGISSAVLDFGGSITAIGVKNDNSEFMIGITSPDNSGIVGTVGISDKSAVTSGDYQRYFEVDGTRYHHIFDTATAFPSRSGISSVTVFCDSAFKADCLSTAAFVGGKEDAKHLLETENCGYVIVDNDFLVDSSVELYEKK